MENLQESLKYLEGIEPDAWLAATIFDTLAISQEGNPGAKQYYSRETVERLLAEHRKQVLLEAADKLNTPLNGDEPAGFAWTRRHILSKLRRMAEGDT